MSLEIENKPSSDLTTEMVVLLKEVLKIDVVAVALTNIVHNEAEADRLITFFDGVYETFSSLAAEESDKQGPLNRKKNAAEGILIQLNKAKESLKK